MWAKQASEALENRRKITAQPRYRTEGRHTEPYNPLLATISSSILVFLLNFSC